MAMEMTMRNDTYAVNFWGSHPDAGNDDCWSGDDFETLAEALAAFALPVKDTSVAYVELDGPGTRDVRANPDHQPETDNASDWQNEAAMQAGMAFGVDGYNDAMGY